MNDKIKTVTFEDIGSNKFRITILEKLETIVDRDEVLEEFFSLSEQLGYETRYKW